MSDTNNIYTTITVPQLTDTKYGENLDTQFNNINNNFTKLGSGAFTKGNKGDSTRAYRLSITTDSRNIYDEAHYIEGILAQAIYEGLKRLLPENAFNYPIGSEPEINVTVIVNRVDNEYILKEFWVTYKGNKQSTPWGSSLMCYDHFKSNLIEVMPFFYIDKKFYSENLNIPKGEKDKTGIYTFNELSDRDGLVITFIQNNIQQSIYYDNSKETWCWALGDNETGIPIYPTYKDRILKPYGKDLSVHHCYYMSKVEHAEGTSEYTLHISPYNGNTSVTDLTCQIYLDKYHSVHARRFISTSSWASDMRSNMIVVVKKEGDNAGLTGNILAEGNITAKGNLIVHGKGTFNGDTAFNGNATFKGNFNMPILGQGPENLRQFLIQVNNRLNALESKK